jgi:hypothetical protein
MFARTMHIPTRREIDSSNSFSAWSILFRWLSGSKAS